MEDEFTFGGGFDEDIVREADPVAQAAEGAGGTKGKATAGDRSEMEVEGAGADAKQTGRKRVRHEEDPEPTSKRRRLTLDQDATSGREARESPMPVQHIAPTGHMMQKQKNGLTKIVLHKATDPGFCSVAVPPDCQKATGLGDDWREWQSPFCRCIPCEVVHIAVLLKGVSMVVLLDLDNWGFQQGLENTTEEMGLAEDVLVWGFHGSGFADTTQVNLQDPNLKWTDISKQLCPKKKEKSAFQDLSERGRLRITPCGGHDQAADMVIREVVRILKSIHCVVITQDKDLGTKCMELGDGQVLKGSTRVHTLNPSRNKGGGVANTASSLRRWHGGLKKAREEEAAKA